MQHRVKRHSKIKILAHNARQAVQRLQKRAGGIHVAADDIRIQPLPERRPADLQIKIPASVAPVQQDASFMRPSDRRSQRTVLVQNRLSASLIDMAENVPGAQRIRVLGIAVGRLTAACRQKLRVDGHIALRGGTVQKGFHIARAAAARIHSRRDSARERAGVRIDAVFRPMIEIMHMKIDQPGRQQAAGNIQRPRIWRRLRADSSAADEDILRQKAIFLRIVDLRAM